MPKTWPTSFARTSNGLGVASSRPSQTWPGRPRRTQRADAPSGSMKVRSIADLFGGSGFVWSGARAPENPVTTASPRLRLGERAGDWAPAVPDKIETRNNSGRSRMTTLDKIQPLKFCRRRRMFAPIFNRSNRCEIPCPLHRQTGAPAERKHLQSDRTCYDPSQLIHPPGIRGKNLIFLRNKRG